MPGAPSTVLAPSSDARSPIVAFLLLVAMRGAPSTVLAPSSDARSPYSSVPAPSSDARSPYSRVVILIRRVASVVRALKLNLLAAYHKEICIRKRFETS